MRILWTYHYRTRYRYCIKTREKLLIVFIKTGTVPNNNNNNNIFKALMANAATSALRLHQRLPQVQFTREFLTQFLLEDSGR